MRKNGKNPENIALNVTNLACERGGFEIFADVSFTAMPGEVILLRGPNGVGKSTCLATLYGALPKSAGEISFENIDSEREPREYLHIVGYVPGVKTTLTVKENLMFWAQLYGGTENVLPAIEAAGLDAIQDSEASILSAGQTRRLGLARLLVANRPIWILDEPTSALDKQGDQWVGQLIADHCAEGGIVIAATHLEIPHLAPEAVKTVMIGHRAMDHAS
ncbi:heme ABC exporter ATP-binding protein CcmA [Maritalea mediterranea]|uniref:Heme ABC exporter ATP-binding protein CcmA n=1 Tax=Maritalea mediterranea TaxID=2909667 RepID=A0ABS9E239_9HYPH|nr:heme ABC exporter ATP-binding protein CcmA [Maritalea mediterranea]MCF4096872.1 heme ABC exporter ATP-binding protein CcmA [Maritalea mediterranea]